MLEQHERVIVVLIKNGDKYLITKSPKWHDSWILMGGHIENNEKPEEALTREVKEETGVDVNANYVFLANFQAPVSDYVRETVMDVWFYLVISPTRDIVLNDEATEYKWVSKNGLSELIAPFNNARAFVN
jgi:8-oxo-dGTP diphosphatase